MPARKHYSIVSDELQIKGGGIYCLMPYDRLDKDKKAVFKVGMSLNFDKRLQTYHTYFPNSVYMVAFLEEPRQQVTRRNSHITKTSFFEKVERWIMLRLREKGAQQIYSTARINRPNPESKEGETEWFHTNEKTIHETFIEAQKKFGGKEHLFFLEGFDPQTNEFTSINQTATYKERDRPNFQGKIIFKL